MTIKGGFDVEGLPAVSGNPVFVERAKDSRDAEIVATARRAGAVIWGKTNVPLPLGDVHALQRGPRRGRARHPDPYRQEA
jgi:amidase